MHIAKAQLSELPPRRYTKGFQNDALTSRMSDLLSPLLGHRWHLFVPFFSWPLLGHCLFGASLAPFGASAPESDARRKLQQQADCRHRPQREVTARRQHGAAESGAHTAARKDTETDKAGAQSHL